ncbi:MAG: D-alanyl-D-alanine carboxypeptidase [Trebonia sp.]|jgi:D-alanyl-D-alanine carboxypeptidase (penicillin-binding protein 5/6)
MRISGRLAASTVAAGLVAVMILAAGPGAHAATVGSPKNASSTTSTNSAVSNRSAKSAKASGPVGVRAHWAELANEVTGKDLWSRSSVTERPMGSITKVMTAYVVIEAGHLNQLITVPKGIIGYDRTYDASTAGLVPGQKLTALQLLYALLLPSGCDAAYTLADAYGHGDPARFVAQMNATARKLGLTKTHFTDFSGLPDPTEYSTYSTARDLVSLGRDAMRLPVFRQVVATRTFRLAADRDHRAYVWSNLDPLLGHFAGATGIKTGFTAVAGDCLLFAADRRGQELIGVVLDSSASPAGLSAAASDAAILLDWGFGR